MKKRNEGVQQGSFFFMRRRAIDVEDTFRKYNRGFVHIQSKEDTTPWGQPTYHRGGGKKCSWRFVSPVVPGHLRRAEEWKVYTYVVVFLSSAIIHSYVHTSVLCSYHGVAWSSVKGVVNNSWLLHTACFPEDGRQAADGAQD